MRPTRAAAVYACGHVYDCRAGGAHKPGRYKERCPRCLWASEQRAAGRQRLVEPAGPASAARDVAEGG